MSNDRVLFMLVLMWIGALVAAVATIPAHGCVR